MESPGSLTFEVQDIDAIVAVAKSKNIITAIDNSWATPLYFKPLDYGIDISIHAITKYINGHSDLLLGAIITNENATKKVADYYKNYGASSSPQECYLALRGIRTLAARLHYQQETLNKVLDYLGNHEKVKSIIAPSHPEFEGYELWKKYFTGATTLFSVELDQKYDQKQISKMVDGYKVIAIGASWGGYESLVRPFDLKGLRSVNSGKYSGSLVRFYLGLESAEDIIEDLEQGFGRL
jgi:cystathionine beta-lyase